jgi:hypothetical protein
MADSSSSPLPGDLPDSPACPFCDERETELHSLFGGHASVTTYWCRRCRSPFEQMKWVRRRFGGGAETRSGEPGNPSGGTE